MPPDTAASAPPNLSPADAAINTSLLLATVLLAGLTPVAAADALAEMPPFSTGLVRFSLAGLTLLTAQRLWPRKSTAARQPIARRDYGRFALAAFLCVPVNQATFLTGVKYSNATHAALFYALTPVLVYLFTVIGGLARLSGRWALATALAFAGAAIIALNGLRVGPGAGYLVGDSLLLGAVTSWALYTIAVRPLTQRYGGVRSAALVMTTGAVMYLPAWLVDGSSFDLARFSRRAVFAFLFITFVTSGINYMIWTVALSRIDINRLAVVRNGAPIVTIIVAYYWRGEPLSLLLFVGAALILSGISLANWDAVRAMLRRTLTRRPAA